MKKFLTLLSALLLSAPVLAQSPQDIVQQANEKWNQALNGGQLEQLVALYDDAATVSPGNGALIEGKDGIKSLFAGFIEGKVHNHQIETKSVIADGDQISQVGYWNAEGFDAEQNPIAFGGVLVTVLQKNDEGEWEIQSHVWNMAP